ncbi:MAG TPA: YceI family protein, partial [Chitinophagaceae bacterium]|nr:YceI family protein [Chitinophagaceae bacterium]
AWKVDTTASKVEWIGTKVTGYHSGVVPVKSGELTVADGTITGGRFVMDMNAMLVTGPKGSDAESNNKLLGHLKSADFFEVSAHPEATFVLTGVKPFTGTVSEENDPRQEDISKYKVSNPTHTVSGNLTIKGVTRNIEFPARITVSGNTVDALAKFNIDRSQWNIVYPGQPDDLIRNDIHLGIALKASR